MLLLVFVSLYGMAGYLLGRLPVNSDFKHAEDGVDISIVHNGIHSEITLPLVTSTMDWREFLSPKLGQPTESMTHGIIGWGNRRFYLETERWEDLKPSLAAEALAGFGDTAVHVEFLSWLPSGDAARRVRLSHHQYNLLCQAIKKSFRLHEGRTIQIPGAAYGVRDAFYEGEGHYHLFNNCNAWTGNVLRASGVRVGWWTPYPSSLFASLPDPYEESLESK